MSKLSSLGQSAAALFSPEGERLRASQDKAAKTQKTNQPVRVPGAQKMGEGQKAQDSLGDSASPGYEFFGKKKKGQEQAPEKKQNQASDSISIPEEKENVIRLQVGWEVLLLAQKKICEKAKGLLLAMEAPIIYSTAKKGKGLQLKSRGCILDLDASQSTPDTTLEENKSDKRSRPKSHERKKLRSRAHKNESTCANHPNALFRSGNWYFPHHGPHQTR